MSSLFGNTSDDDELSGFELIDDSVSAGDESLLHDDGWSGGSNLQVALELPASMRFTTTQACTDKDTENIQRKQNLETRSYYANKSDSDDGSSTASWSHLGGGGSGGESIAASSTISGFDILSLSNGEVMHCCHRCTFLNNSDNAGVCGGCGIALVSNPCLDVDEQIARNLQQQEEDYALQQLQAEQKKLKSLAEETLLVRSQFLVREVVSFVMRCKETEGQHARRVDFIQKESLVILASRFLESADRANMEGRAVQMLYHFSTKMPSLRLDGLGSHASLSNNIEAAYAHSERDINSHRMLPIHEDSELDNVTDNNILWGWIVAAVTLPSDERMVKVSSGLATVWDRVESAECLPLVCFDASLQKDDIIRRLVNGLSTICFDFFQNCWMFAGQHEIEKSILRSSEPDKILQQNAFAKNDGHEKAMGQPTNNADRDGLPKMIWPLPNQAKSVASTDCHTKCPSDDDISDGGEYI